MRVQSLGLQDPLEEGMATHASILPWRNPAPVQQWYSDDYIAMIGSGIERYYNGKFSIHTARAGCTDHSSGQNTKHVSVS